MQFFNFAFVKECGNSCGVQNLFSFLPLYSKEKLFQLTYIFYLSEVAFIYAYVLI